jgi:hypothetical protein
MRTNTRWSNGATIILIRDYVNDIIYDIAQYSISNFTNPGFPDVVLFKNIQDNGQYPK